MLQLGDKRELETNIQRKTVATVPNTNTHLDVFTNKMLKSTSTSTGACVRVLHRHRISSPKKKSKCSKRYPTREERTGACAMYT